MKEEKTFIKELKHGEVYETTNDYTWSVWDDGNKHVVVPKHERLMFRSEQKCKGKNKDNLVLFYQLDKKRTLCLMATNPNCWIPIKHIPWEERNE